MLKKTLIVLTLPLLSVLAIGVTTPCLPRRSPAKAGGALFHRKLHPRWRARQSEQALPSRQPLGLVLFKR